MSYKIHPFTLGPMGNLYYLLIHENKNCVLIDAGFEVERIIDFIQKEGLTLTQVWLTHTHYDHVDGLPSIINKYANIPIYVHEKESAKIKKMTSHTEILKHGDIVRFEDQTFKILFTPGHSPGSICYHNAPILFSGDTLFVNAIGRCDLPFSDVDAMYNSLYETLWPLPDDTQILAGHMTSDKLTDTLGNQKQTNPYLKNADKNKFIRKRMF